MSNKIIIKDAGFSLITFVIAFLMIYLSYDYIFPLLNNSYANKSIYNNFYCKFDIHD